MLHSAVGALLDDPGQREALPWACLLKQALVSCANLDTWIDANMMHIGAPTLVGPGVWTYLDGKKWF